MDYWAISWNGLRVGIQMLGPSRQLIHLYSAYVQVFIRPMFLAVDNYLLLAEFGKYSATPYTMNEWNGGLCSV